MSNLSELLPTGGGQNVVEFTAAETLTAGQVVSLKTDGQIEATDSGNISNVIGITAASIASGQSGNVNIFGGINEAQTGLTVGSDYYIDNTGAISTSPPSVGRKLGKAISATTLNLLDYPSVIFTQGQQAFTTAGAYSWVAPPGVTSVSVVAVGAGNVYGGGGSPKAGGGGGLGYKNSISVTPGTSYTVFVGAANSASTDADGEDSYFIDTSTVKGGGAFFNSGTLSNSGGTYVGDGGGNGGGTGGNTVAGGGAGGYSGNGGNGASNYGSGSAGSGGGAGGGGQGVAYDRVQGATGGGVGILGEGSSGAGGTGNTVQAPTGGGGGSGGGNGDWGSGPGGAYGGGGAIDYDASLIQRVRPGADGAVRIIWGSNRAFPSTNTGDL